MRSPVALGAYVPARTLVHAIDARAKLVLLVIATVESFASTAPVGLAVAAAGLVVALVARRTGSLIWCAVTGMVAYAPLAALGLG